MAVISCGIASAQTEAPIQSASPDVPQFFVDALSFSSDKAGLSRLDVYVDVGYDVLHFIDDGGLYRAGYETTISLHDTMEHAVDEKAWVETVETRDYEKSISPTTSNLTQRSFTVPPGRYSLTVQITDSETKKVARHKRTVNVKDYSISRCLLSDIMLVNALTLEGERKAISPNISGNVGNHPGGFYVFFEVYHRLNIDSTLIAVKVYNDRHLVVQHDSFYQKLTSKKTACIRRISMESLMAGEYGIDVEAYPHQQNADGSSVDAVAFSSRPFMLRWKGLPNSIANLDMAIDQMQYMVEKEELDRMKKAEGEKKREIFFLYWKRRDPSPNTDRNELMEEYYSRVEYANKHFGHYIDGWRSDMGMVYIIFGVASNIERHPFDIDAKPYEIWTYYDSNREFVFVDQTGFGDFKLQNPIWDIWRNRPH